MCDNLLTCVARTVYIWFAQQQAYHTVKYCRTELRSYDKNTRELHFKIEMCLKHATLSTLNTRGNRKSVQ